MKRFYFFLYLEPTAFGNISSMCGVYLLLGQQQKTWQEAEKFCCSVGMNLLTIFSVEKLSCLYNVFSTGSLKLCAKVQRFDLCIFEKPLLSKMWITGRLATTWIATVDIGGAQPISATLPKRASTGSDQGRTAAASSLNCRMAL